MDALVPYVDDGMFSCNLYTTTHVLQVTPRLLEIRNILGMLYKWLFILCCLE